MADLDLGLPPMLKKGSRKRVTKKHHTTNNVPVDVSVRRQVSGEIGDGEPTKDQKFILLQKFGVTTPRIDRLVTKPKWKGIAEWKRQLNEFFQATKGLVNPSQRPRSFRPNLTSQQRSNNQTPGFKPRRLGDPRFPERFHPTYQKPKPWSQISKARRPDTRESQVNSGQTPTENLPN